MVLPSCSRATEATSTDIAFASVCASMNDDLWSEVARFLPPPDAFSFAQSCRAGAIAWRRRLQGWSLAALAKTFEERFALKQVAGTSAMTRGERALHVDLSRADARALRCFSTALTLGALEVRSLYFAGMGVEGGQALANALSCGALARLEKLLLDFNRLGDVGVAAISNAVGDGGGLARLRALSLRSIQVGDAGASALAGVIAKGAMVSLTDLDLSYNLIGDQGATAIAQSTVGRPPSVGWPGPRGGRLLVGAPAGGPLSKLKTLWLGSNQIGDEGLRALCTVLTNGSLEGCQRVPIWGNPASEQMQEKLRGLVASRSRRRPMGVTVWTPAGTGNRRAHHRHAAGGASQR